SNIVTISSRSAAAEWKQAGARSVIVQGLTTNELESSAAGSLDEFLLERYTAFTQSDRHRRFFRIWHEPWQHVAAKVEIVTDDLIRATESWWRDAGYVGANYSPGVNVWMGWPHKIHDVHESTL